MQMTIVVISIICNILLAKYGAMSKYSTDIPIAIDCYDCNDYYDAHILYR